MNALFANRLLAWLNLRTLLALIALALLLSPTLPDNLHWLDRLIFRFGSSLQNIPSPALGVSLVELPEDEVHFLLEEPGRANKSLQLLERITGSDKVTVALLVPADFTAENDLEALLGTMLWPGEGDSLVAAGEARQAAEDYLGTHHALRGLQDSPRLVIAGREGAQLAVHREPSAAIDQLRWLPGFLHPQLPETFLRNDGALQLLAASGGHLRASLPLQVYARFAGSSSIAWQQHDAVQVGAAVFPLSGDGSFIPYPHDQRLPRHSLDYALENRLNHNLILIAAANSPALDQLANALRSLDGNTYYYTPFWYSAVWALLLIVLAAYLLVVLPRLGFAAGALATSLIGLVLLVAQLGWQITQWQWIALGGLLQFVVIGHLLMFVWKRQHENQLQLQAAAHGARYQLGLQLFRDGRSDDALLAIRDCHNTDAVLSLMYDVAAQQERKRHYGEAVKTYLEIVKRRKGFRDAAQKVEKLIAFNSGGAASLGSDSAIAKTLIISESSINKPVLGRYEIERELGRGAMGVVYLGRDPKIARQVAIKTLSYAQVEASELDEFKQRFFREAEAAGRLNHPNIVTIYDVGEEHDLAFIAMDYVEGMALSACVNESQRLPVSELIQAMAEVADALDYAHSKQVIHRDVKPANIMYEPQRRRVKVTDFGVARLADGARTSTGNILGSPLYMSPEQLRGGRVEAQSDIYSLGVSLFQLSTGELPFNGDNLASLTYNIIHQKPPTIRQLRPELPASLARIVNRALHKEPQKRYPSAAAMAQALRKVLDEQ